jgi:oxalate decarboxylase
VKRPIKAEEHDERRNPTRSFVRRSCRCKRASRRNRRQSRRPGSRAERAPGVGGSDPAPGDVAREAQNPDLLNPPATDSGTLPNLRFSFADAHVRQSSGGWTRQVTARELGISKAIAGVNMRLNAGGIRELHWHKHR